MIPLITSANVAYGYHVSDPIVMERTVSIAKDYALVKGIAEAIYEYDKDLIVMAQKHSNL